MKIINFVKKEDGDDYTLTTYSDNQIDLIIPHVIPGAYYTIVSRCSSYSDLITIVSANQILKDAGVQNVDLLCPYVLGGRSDAKFKTNQSFGLKIVTNIINSCNFDTVIVLDPHSAVTPALINNCRVTTVEDWFDFTRLPKDAVLVSPDAGAYKKMVGLSEKHNLELVAANKVRTSDGLPRIAVAGSVENKDCYIIDDICDGGRTFITLAEKLKKRGAKSVTLIVTHGIFAYGFVLDNIDKIYTTNSYRSFDDIGDADPIDPNYFNVFNVF